MLHNVGFCPLFMNSVQGVSQYSTAVSITIVVLSCRAIEIRICHHVDFFTKRLTVYELLYVFGL